MEGYDGDTPPPPAPRASNRLTGSGMIARMVAIKKNRENLQLSKRVLGVCLVSFTRTNRVQSCWSIKFGEICYEKLG